MHTALKSIRAAMILLLIVATSGLAQGTQPSARDTFAGAREHTESGDRPAPPQRPWPLAIATKAFEGDRQAGYLSSVLDLLEREQEARDDPNLTNLYLDVLATRLAQVGEHARATAVGDEAYGAVGAKPTRPEGPDPLLGFEPRPAVDAIVEAASGRRLMMVNEEHRSSMQRAFTNRLLAPLRVQGFDYLALEGVGEDAAALNRRGYPVLSSGTYTRDPAFGDLIRRAIELGYTIVAYEATADQMESDGGESHIDRVNRRERAQAVNIFKRTFQRDADARVLVYGGRGHIAEAAGSQWRPMGGVLRELSGIDPLTINLYQLVEHSKQQYEDWAFTAADKAGWLSDDAIVLANESGSFWSFQPDAYDAFLIHPRTTDLYGRPGWMTMGEIRTPVHVDIPAFDEPVLLQAHRANESDEAVPLDQIILWPGRPTPALMLRPGVYVIRVIDRDGSVLHRAEEAVGRR